MPSNRRVREGRLNQSQVDNARRKSRTRIARMYIEELGAYKGTKPIDLLFYDKKTGLTYNWLERLILEGKVREEDVSINGAFPDRPIQIVLSQIEHKAVRSKSSAVRKAEHEEGKQRVKSLLLSMGDIQIGSTSYEWPDGKRVK